MISLLQYNNNIIFERNFENWNRKDLTDLTFLRENQKKSPFLPRSLTSRSLCVTNTARNSDADFSEYLTILLFSAPTEALKRLQKKNLKKETVTL